MMRPLPAPTRYVRTLGPFPIEGHEFTVKLNVICYKESQHEGMCNEDDEETASSVKIVDENGKGRFSKSFPVSPRRLVFVACNIFGVPHVFKL